MINVLLERKKSGSLVSCSAEGHAEYAGRGYDIVCSAVTVLLRTVLQILEETDGIELETNMSRRGFLSFKVKNQVCSSGLEERLGFAGLFLEKGLASVSEEYPENVSVKYTTV